MTLDIWTSDTEALYGKGHKSLLWYNKRLQTSGIDYIHKQFIVYTTGNEMCIMAVSNRSATAAYCLRVLPHFTRTLASFKRIFRPPGSCRIIYPTALRERYGEERTGLVERFVIWLHAAAYNAGSRETGRDYTVVYQNHSVLQTHAIQEHLNGYIRGFKDIIR
jgi:hypothetical protein